MCIDSVPCLCWFPSACTVFHGTIALGARGVCTGPDFHPPTPGLSASDNRSGRREAGVSCSEAMAPRRVVSEITSPELLKDGAVFFRASRRPARNVGTHLRAGPRDAPVWWSCAVSRSPADKSRVRGVCPGLQRSWSSLPAWQSPAAGEGPLVWSRWRVAGSAVPGRPILLQSIDPCRRTGSLNGLILLVGEVPGEEVHLPEALPMSVRGWVCARGGRPLDVDEGDSLRPSPAAPWRGGGCNSLHFTEQATAHRRASRLFKVSELDNGRAKTQTGGTTPNPCPQPLDSLTSPLPEPGLPDSHLANAGR